MAEYSPESGQSPKTDAELLLEARDRLKENIDRESQNRIKQKDDLLFCTLEQWPDSIRSARENDPNGARPCLTIDQINQYIVQVENDERQNRPSIKIRPVDDRADVKTAEVLQGIVRQIEDQSNAQVAYITAGGSAVRVGEGYFRVVTEYENETSFNQVIRIKRVPDMFCVYLGLHQMPDGSDAEYGFIFEDIPLQTFRRLYPKAKYQSTDFSGIDNFTQYWGDYQKTVRIAEYFYTVHEDKTLVFLADGRSMTAEKYDQLTEKPEVKDRRASKQKKIKWCKLTGLEILEKRDWAGKYVPIVKVTGKEAWIDGQRITWGLVRPAKDSLRMYNYWASTITEKIGLAPKTPFIGAKGQFEGQEDRWAQANVQNFSYLEYNAMTVDQTIVPAPQRQQPAPLEVAMIQQLQVIREDVKASLGMYKASLGQEQPNQSGKAILALVRESDTGTFHFQDNLSISIRYCGIILTDLAPKIYDTARIMKILGEDGKVEMCQLDPEQQEACREIQDSEGKIRNIYNIGIGEYDVTSTVGPSYNTKRMEAATLFTDLANSSKDPASAAVVRYLAIKNSDFNGAQQAAEMLEKLLPPGLVKKEGQPEIPPEVQQQLQQMEQAGNELLQENQELKSGQQEALAKVEAQAQADQAKIAEKAKADEAELELKHQLEMRKLELEREVETEKASIARKKVEEEIALARWKAEQEIEIDRMRAENEREVALKKATMQPAGNA